MGFIKQWSYTDPSEEEQEALSLRFGWLQFGGAVGAFSCIAFTIRSMMSVKRSVEERRRQGTLEQVDCNWSAALASNKICVVATTFQVGNVFYEILFGAVNERKEFLDWCYFGLAVVSFVLGVIGVAVSSYQSHAIHTLSTTDERAIFAFETHKFNYVLTVLYALSLFAWLLHFCISASIKYPEQQTWCICSGCSALLIISVAWARVVYIAADFNQLEVNPSAQDGEASSPSTSPNKSFSEDPRTPFRDARDHSIDIDTAMKVELQASTN